MLIEPTLQDIGRRAIITTLLVQHPQSQEGAGFRGIGKRSPIELFGRLSLPRNGRDASVVPPVKGHCQPGEKVGVQRVEFRLVQQLDIFGKRWQQAMEAVAQQASLRQHGFLIHGGIGFIVKDVFDRRQPEVVRPSGADQVVLIETRARENIQDIKNCSQGLDLTHQIERFPNSSLTVACRKSGPDVFDLNAFVQKPAYLGIGALDAVADLNTPGPAHPAQYLLVHRVHPRYGRPADIELPCDDGAADRQHDILAQGEGIVREIKERHPPVDQALDLVHKVFWGMPADAVAPKAGGAAKTAIGGAAPG